MAINLNINLKTINGESITGIGDLVINSINWRGELVAAPDTPKDYDAYHNLNDGNTYLYFDGRWQIFSAKGEKGDEGDGLSELEIGTPINNSTAKSILFVDENGKLGEIANFQYDENDESLSFLNGDDIGLLLNYDAEVDDGVFANLNGIAKMDAGAPTAFVGVTDLSIFDPSFGDGVLITSDEQVLITSDEQVLITSENQVLIISENQVLIASGEQVVIGTDGFVYASSELQPLMTMEKSVVNDKEVLLSSFNGAWHSATIAIKADIIATPFLIEDKNNQIRIMYDEWSEKGWRMYPDAGMEYSDSEYVSFKVTTVDGIYAPTFETYNRNPGVPNRDTIALYKQDASIDDYTSYVAGTGIDDATWDGYTIGQLFQAMKNMGFLA